MIKLRDALKADLSRALSLFEDQYMIVEPIDAPCYIVTGAGDSYAASMLAPHLNPLASFYDPMDIAYSINLSKLAERGCILIAVSLGGKTRMVLKAVEAYRKAGGRVVAVTADPSSKLAALADKTIIVLHAGLAAGVGAGRHLLTLVALGALLGAPKPSRPDPSRTKCPNKFYGFIYAGCCETTSSALYASLKVYEVYGLPSYWWPLEQLVHAPVFGLPGDRVLLFKPIHAGERIEETVRVLSENDIDVTVVEPWGSHALENAAWNTVWIINCLSESSDIPDKPRYLSHRGLEKLTKLIYTD